MSDRRKIFYGWWVVAIASLGLCFSTGTIVVLSFGVFLQPLSRYFHVGRAAVSLAFTLHGLVGALCIPLTGRLIDRFGARRTILAGTAIFGFVLLGSLSIGAHITYLYLFYLMLGLLTGSTSPVPYSVVVSRWFDRKRGLALGLMAVGLGVGASLIPLLAQRLIQQFDWRIAYGAFGLTALLVTMPAVAAFLKDDPRKHGMWPDGVQSLEFEEAVITGPHGLTWRATWHEPAFWRLVSGFFLAGAGLFACVLHMPALLMDRGISSQGAATASSMVGIALLVGRLGVGYLLDRFFAPRLATVVFTGSAVGMVLLLMGSAGEIALIAAFLIGIGMGAEVDIIAYMMGRYFGLRALGTAIGYGFGSFALGGAVGVLLMGAAFDLTHAYTAGLVGFLLAMMLAVALISRLGPYRYAMRQDSETQPNAAEIQS